TTQTNHVVLVGFGRVGSIIGDALIAAKQPLLVVEQNDKIAASLRERGVEVLGGQAAPADIIAAANIPAARWLVVAIPE
ncbi:NAD-binding protein, partial [Acinetobacter baumannii]